MICCVTIALVRDLIRSSLQWEQREIYKNWYKMMYERRHEASKGEGKNGNAAVHDLFFNRINTIQNSME